MNEVRRGEARHERAGGTGAAPIAARSAYRLWAPTYGTSGDNALTEAVDRAVWRVLPSVTGAAVLDVGCGLGRWSSRVVAGGGLAVGVDFVEAMLRAGEAGLPRAVADVEHLPFRESFDGAICSLVLSHVEALSEPLEQIRQALRRGGWFVLADIHPDTAALGWRRTFRGADGQSREVAWTPHPIADVVAALHRAGLATEALAQESLEPDRRASGPGDEAGPPAAYALIARKA